MALQQEFEKQGIWLFRYRGVLPLIILVIGAAVYLRTKLYPETFFLEGTVYQIYYETACLVISLIGLVIRVYTIGHSAKNTSGRNKFGQVAQSLNTTGIYSIVRHPLYLGNFFMWFGLALLTGNLWFIIAFIFFYWLYYERIMFAEEQFLTREFGDTYLDWAKDVPPFIPSFKKFKSTNLSFCWKKVLGQEKNGLVAVFLVFTLFNVSGEIIQKQTNFNYFLIVCTIITTLLYFVLKYLKNKTTVLNETER